jgi:transposase-like protein
MEYAIDNLLDEDKCYAHLVEYFHNGHLRCCSCQGTNYHVHQSRRRPVLQYKCRDCHSYFNVFSGTAFQGTHWSCSKVVMILRGFLKGESTLAMSEEMGLGYRNLLYLRHRLMSNAFVGRELDALSDSVTESDEMYQNSGEKGIAHLDPDDPPRRRANKKKGLAHFPTTARQSLEPLAGRVGKSV